MRTWEICMNRVRRTGVGLFGRSAGRDSEMFLRRFETISRPIAPEPCSTAVWSLANLQTVDNLERIS